MPPGFRCSQDSDLEYSLKYKYKYNEYMHVYVPCSCMYYVQDQNFLIGKTGPILTEGLADNSVPLRGDVLTLPIMYKNHVDFLQT